METRKIQLSEIDANKGQVKGLPANPRKWTQDSLRRLAESLRDTPELLDARGLLVYPHAGRYVAIGGNMRLEALREQGEKEAPCVVIPEETSVDKLKELVLKDNSSFGEWDAPKLEADWGDLPLEDWGLSWEATPSWRVEQSEDLEEDAPPEPEVDERADTKPGEVFRLGDSYLICGDSTEKETYVRLARAMGKTPQVRLLLTDPPYNIDYTGGEDTKRERLTNDNQSPQAFQEFLTQAFRQVNPWLARGASIYVWMAVTNRKDFITAYDSMPDWHRAQELVWVKNTFTLGHSDYQWQHEGCIYGWRTGAGHYFVNSRSKSTIILDPEEDLTKNPDTMKKDELVRLCRLLQEEREVLQTDVLRAPKPLASEHHPTTKPVRLFGRQVANSSQAGDWVLDPFAGSGTTMIACQRLGRKSLSIELSPGYCDAIRARYHMLTGRDAERVE